MRAALNKTKQNKKKELLGVEAEAAQALRVSFLSPVSKLIRASLPKAPSLHLHPSFPLSEAFQLGYRPFCSAAFPGMVSGTIRVKHYARQKS